MTTAEINTSRTIAPGAGIGDLLSAIAPKKRLPRVLGHQDDKLGYCIHECTRRSKAVVSDPSLGGSFPIVNTQAAIERDASKAAPRNRH
ncbi:hypothetical protein [Pseudomonas fluorescens]|uniref:hypothetical protein n=1 Tax=Pseudomonas fluorescens TaxID=294 RepID=UPI0010DFCD9E|nr:hypothetical protein [Pseudomonas fluorescens]TCV62727.1 hypothetical protein EDB98_11235 [Pseudomonas fluorescens]